MSKFGLFVWLGVLNLVEVFQCQKYDNMSIKFNDYKLSTVSLKNRMHLKQNAASLNYCSFFNNRAPSPQINLKNCTWYNENSCCLQSEIESTFSKVKPLIGSSELCQKYLNNLMCYICAPNQFKFYGKERLTVCKQYCDKMFVACGDAILKGSRINEIYSNGEEFCKSRRYNIDILENDNCFYYDVESRLMSGSHKLRKKYVDIVLAILFIILIYK